MLTPAQTLLLHELARDMDAAPPTGGARPALVARAAEALGRSPKTVYALLRRVTGRATRRPRSDKGVSALDNAPELLREAAGLLHFSRRLNGKQTMSLKDARERLAANGRGVQNNAGEIVMPGCAALSRALRKSACHPRQLAQAAPATQLRSLHPNHVWEADASVCVLYRLPGGGVRLVDEKVYNQHKPRKMAEIADRRVIRYVVADHYSGCLYVRYEQAAGEDAAGVLRTLVAAMSDRGPQDPMHGVPDMLFMDKGSGNCSSLVTQFLADLGCTPVWHRAGNARATGAVEAAQNLVERGFESRLRFMEIPSLEELQAQADRWRRHFNARNILTRAGRPRNLVWLAITDAQLRTASRAVLEAVAHWRDETRVIDNHFKIRVDTRTHGVQEYDLRELGYHGLTSGDRVKVRLSPFRAPAVVVIKELPDGKELRYEVAPVARDAAGFDLSAPVLGQEYRAQPRTAAEKNLDEIRMRATGADNARDAEKIIAAKNRPLFPDIDIMADVAEAPAYLRRAGRPAAVEAPTAEPAPLNRAQAAARLAQLCGEAWAADPAGCNALIRERWPTSVPETALPELAALIRARHAAAGVERPARRLAFNLNHAAGGETSCAG